MTLPEEQDSKYASPFAPHRENGADGPASNPMEINETPNPMTSFIHSFIPVDHICI